MNPDKMENPESALAACQRLQAAAAALGFAWPDAAAVLLKLDEEVAELREALAAGDAAHAAEELGDVMLVCADLAGKLGLRADDVLRAATAKFEKRYHAMLAHAAGQGRDFAAMTLDEKKSLWEWAKKQA